jgi:hypothetical protein
LRPRLLERLLPLPVVTDPLPAAEALDGMPE